MRPVVSITLEDIERARGVIAGVVRDTPVKRSTTLSAMTGSDIYLKLENFQRTGSFKVRGALNKLHSLDGETGVVAASAGNHAQGVAFAAAKAGVRSDIFMPEDATHAKVVATKGYGANIHLVGKDYQEAYEAADAFCKDQGAEFVHAFDDPLIMAGQGTLGIEVFEDVKDVETVIVPIGGGGLISGVAVALKELNPDIRIVGVQAEGASTVAPSLNKGRVVPADSVRTMADGIACRRLGDHTFDVIKRHVDEVVLVSEAEIARSILFLLERTKVVVEGAGAVSLAATLSGKVDVAGQTTCAVISGGNIDTTLLSRIIQRGLVEEDRIMHINTDIQDRPGAIASLLALLGEHKANVLDVQHQRDRIDVPLHETRVEVTAEVRGPEHKARIQRALQAAGYSA